MKIYADSFKRWIRILETYQIKDDPIGECLYINFNDTCAYFGSQDGVGRIKFYIEATPNEKIKNFFIPTHKFLSIITQYDYIDVDENFLFTHNSDRYKVPVIVDEDKFNDEPFKKTFTEPFNFEKSVVEQVSKAMQFSNKDEQNINYRNIFIQDGYICTLTTATPLYEAKITVDEKLSLPLNVARSLCQIGLIAEGCKILTSDSTKLIVSRDDEIELIVPSSSSVEFPQNRNEQFITSYSHENSLELTYDVFSKTIKSLKPYFNDVLNAKIYIVIGEQDLEIQVVDSKNEIVKHCAYEAVSAPLVNKKYAISGSKIEQALNVINGKKLYIGLPTDDSNPIVNFWNDDSQHVLIVRFQQ